MSLIHSLPVNESVRENQENVLGAYLMLDDAEGFVRSLPDLIVEDEQEVYPGPQLDPYIKEYLEENPTFTGLLEGCEGGDQEGYEYLICRGEIIYIQYRDNYRCTFSYGELNEFTVMRRKYNSKYAGDGLSAIVTTPSWNNRANSVNKEGF